ncbi:heat shock protein 75 kDa, mitochondrial isoform X2 [Agrilus planipennis]|uniref:Heat shock protein 75 kDa, mitochondrial n=1 Tax=Agrilus planipennis TaxID=224129 RepID=A0A1W4X5B4_AGRPL|nr:heat shock protein 75 kDa, mitochondrial isoform X1 [Agrilus planipennis]XP_018327579.1 heat shock protein 75 kDa, mitochondrial isoform X1 [Agrilus planipennis]XP_018327580.1 heat shock protein 75 kDa, mitochondrial isoform X1 [Agrilus planipennis]XP_025834018.1 heat shock protein 75 kDa, mitochondrial isoform X2 [Agrilus planipennis]
MLGFTRYARLVYLPKLCRCLSAAQIQNAAFHRVPNNSKVLANISSFRLYTTQTQTAGNNQPQSKETEKLIGSASKHEFQAETKMLLDIVARSLYSEKEVFLRELISNASDALEKFRYNLLTKPDKEPIHEPDRPLEIHIKTDKQNRTLIIQDTGIGMTRDALISNLGIIARSGSKAFLEQVQGKSSPENASKIIGQFGVGFYSAFMVADKVDVYTKAANESNGYKWSSDGSGSYEVQLAEGVNYGTKIVITLKPECREYADEEVVKKVIQKYSNFVGHPIYLNGNVVNTVEAIWLKDQKNVTKQQHHEFYRYISNSYDLPRFILHYHADVPLSIHALLYFPEGKPGLFEMSRETHSGVALYTRKVLIKSQTDNIVPKWLRFLKGVVDSEDLPLNLSRELLQNSTLINKLRDVLTGRVIKFLQEQSKKATDEYLKFYTDYGIFLKEGIITNQNQSEKEEIAKLLRFESSHKDANVKVGFEDYVSGIKESQKIIYYLAAPSRALAEASPYYESLKQKQYEVLFCYEPYDELVLMQLQQFKGYRLISVEKDMRDDKAASDLTNLGEDSLRRSEINDLTSWLKGVLKDKAANVNATTRLQNHPCVITVEEMAAARHFIKTQSHQIDEQRRFALLQPQLEINPKHPLIKKMYRLMQDDPPLGELLAKQLFANAMVGAGLVDDPRMLLTSINELLERALTKH